MRLGVIGFGNVGKSFTQGIINAGVLTPEDIDICVPSEESCALASARGFTVFKEPSKLFERADMIFIAVKGYVFEDICKTSDVSKLCKKTIVSFIAGMKIDEIKKLVGVDCEVIRAMPTIAMGENMGVTGLTYTDNAFIKEIFAHLGYAFEVDECDIERVTAFSGCGLGFAAYLISSYVKAGTALGFEVEQSKKITELIFASALKCADYDNTVKRVATKGGATEKGVAFLNENKVDKLIAGAVQSAYEKFSK